MIARVVFKSIRWPSPYRPSTHPVFTRNAVLPCASIFRPRISAYAVGCNSKKGAPKHAENVAFGSVIPTSVPATLAVYPARYWYIAWSRVRRDTGGSTPNASHVRKMMLLACPPRDGSLLFSIWWIGYETRVFSVFELS